jgi:hypothetical protein
MMKIAIYQINIDRDKRGAMFMGLDMLGTRCVDEEIYDKVFEGVVPCESLEDVYVMFNVQCPSNYRGRSPSVSDVVEVIDEEGQSAFHFCDSIGFKEIVFDADLTSSREDEKLKSFCVSRDNPLA